VVVMYVQYIDGSSAFQTINHHNDVTNLHNSLLQIHCQAIVARFYSVAGLLVAATLHLYCRVYGGDYI
jgi:hypothetical protein